MYLLAIISINSLADLLQYTNLIFYHFCYNFNVLNKIPNLIRGLIFPLVALIAIREPLSIIRRQLFLNDCHNSFRNCFFFMFVNVETKNEQWYYNQKVIFCLSLFSKAFLSQISSFVPPNKTI